jgi:molecular chaperone HscB
VSPPDPGQHPDADPFALLGLPRRFDLTDAQIEKAFLARLAGVHPDLAGDEAGADAAALTGARAVLADPERRAGTLLALLGGPGPAVDRSLPDGFLMEIMELRERVESDLADAGPREEARDRWTRFAGDRRQAHIDRVARLFADAPPGGPPGGETLAEIRLELNAWRYTERLIEQLDPGYDPADEPGLAGPG